METKEWRYVDKSSWHAGPWHDEPDKRQWVDEDTGLPCLIVRGPSGALCGYVGVSRAHPLYGTDYDARVHSNCPDGDWCMHSAVDVDVHGGLTFADRCRPGEGDRGICHVVEPGEDDDVWWFGFDCAHYLDLAPAHSREYAYDPSAAYRGIRYVTNQVTSLAEQLKALQGVGRQ